MTVKSFKPTIESIIAQLLAAYPNAQASVETIAIYDRLLCHIPAGELQIIIDQCIVECKFLPTVAEIMERYRATIHVAHGVGITAADGWQEVTRAFWQVGYTGTPIFSPITARVVASLGWRELCQSENQMADRAHFMRMYDQIVERNEREQRLLPQTKALTERHRDAGELTSLRVLLGDMNPVKP
jgi:hypothetical protein